MTTTDQPQTSDTVRILIPDHPDLYRRATPHITSLTHGPKLLAVTGLDDGQVRVTRLPDA